MNRRDAQSKPLWLRRLLLLIVLPFIFGLFLVDAMCAAWDELSSDWRAFDLKDLWRNP